MRVLLADPPAFTPQYDHALASALAQAGADVELVTSPFRFGEPPEPDGYRRSELFYPVSSRVFRRSRLRIPVKLVEHPVGLARLRRRRADVAHLQWLAAPELDDRLLRVREPLVFTAHDLLPRRTAEKQELWRRLFGRFERIVVHSERGRDQLAELTDEERLRVIPHPVFPSDPPRSDDGRTLLSLGIIRAYKGIGDAIEATKAVDGTRLLVAGDPLEARLSLERGGRPGARRRNGRALSLPARDRPERGPATGARRRRPGRRVRRRRARGAGSALRRGPGRTAGRRRRADRGSS
jgi:glycosyltransferase involved in cell wall biosynthesis